MPWTTRFLKRRWSVQYYCVHNRLENISSLSSPGTVDWAHASLTDGADVGTFGQSSSCISATVSICIRSSATLDVNSVACASIRGRGIPRVRLGVADQPATRPVERIYERDESPCLIQGQVCPQRQLHDKPWPVSDNPWAPRLPFQARETRNWNNGRKTLNMP